jgi:N-sulfoglucosamine sulfohydrolase
MNFSLIILILLGSNPSSYEIHWSLQNIPTTFRWPAGNPETGYLNWGGGATKIYILKQRYVYGRQEFWELNFGKRVPEELYQIVTDPYCMHNLVNESSYARIAEALKAEQAEKLTAQSDPRMLGNGDLFMTYPYAEENRGLNEKIMAGQKVNTGWVYDSDFEPEWVENSESGF